MAEAIEIALPLCYPAADARAVDAAAVAALAASIGTLGLLQPVSVRRCRRERNGQEADAYEVLAGLHRVKAFRRLGRETIPAFVIEADDLIAALILIDENLCRNDLSPAERAAATARRKCIYEQLHPETKHGEVGRGRAKDRVANLATLSDDEPAERFTEATSKATGHSERAVQRDARRGAAIGAEGLKRLKGTSLDKGEELDALAKLPAKQREALIDQAAAGKKVSAKAEEKRGRRDAREVSLAGRIMALPEQKFGVILADPEWRYKPYSRETGLDRGADNHYPTSPLVEIMRRPVAKIAAADCILFLWATVPMLAEAFCVLDAWGFASFVRDPATGFLEPDKSQARYVSSAVWTKYRPGQGIGMGHWFRVDHEILLVATRGRVVAPAEGDQWRSIFNQPASRVHSEKPELPAEMIEALWPHTPKIEMNRRGPARPGWKAWGNEATPEQPRSGVANGAEMESQAKAEEAVRPDKAQAEGVMPRGEQGADADLADDAASRLPDGRTPGATEVAGRDSRERPAPDLNPHTGLERMPDLPACLKREGEAA